METIKNYWKSGSVAITPEGLIVFKYMDTLGTTMWLTGDCGSWDGPVKELRRAAVIDPEDREQVERLIRTLDKHFDGRIREEVSPEDLTDMQSALREFATPTPPKPDEPTEWQAIAVEADGTIWHRVRDGEGDGFPWATKDSKAKWENLNIVRTFPPPTVTTEGVQE